jgi:hypothetical protein
VRGNSNRRGVQQWWLSPLEGMVAAHQHKSGGGQGSLVLRMGQTVTPDGGELPRSLFAGSGGSAREGEGWSAQRSLDQSSEGKREGEGSGAPARRVATRQEEEGGPVRLQRRRGGPGWRQDLAAVAPGRPVRVCDRGHLPVGWSMERKQSGPREKERIRRAQMNSTNFD